MNNPLVSIIVPTYNRAHLISETLDSVLAQTYTNWECIVVDDGSMDHTQEVVEEYVKKDARFQYYHRPISRHKGANACRNYGFELSKGEYIQHLDSDDLISSNKIEAQVITIVNGKGNDIATCKWGYFRTNLNDTDLKENEPYYNSYSKGLDLLNKLGINREYFPMHVYLVKREIIEISGGWDESLHVNQDGEFFCRVLLNCNNIIFVQKAKAYYRINAEISTSSSNTQEKMIQRIESWKIINNHILKKHKINNSKYVRNAKETLFFVILKKYPEIIKMNRIFFHYQILRNLNLIVNNLIIKIAKKINKKFLE